MSYNLYQVQMSKAWSERVNKENVTAERFWKKQAALAGSGRAFNPAEDDLESLASERTGATGRTIDTVFLKNKIANLESQLNEEKSARLKVEEDLIKLSALPEGDETRSQASMAQ